LIIPFLFFLLLRLLGSHVCAKAVSGVIDNLNLISCGFNFTKSLICETAKFYP